MRVFYPLCAAVFIASYGGALHPALDSLAVLRMPLAALLVVLIALPRWRRNRAGLAVSALAAWALIWSQLLWSAFIDDRATFTIYQRNLWFGNTSIDALLTDIEARDPDVITLQEVSPRNDVLIDRLSQDYPHQARCTYSWRYSIAVLSRLPQGPTAKRCSDTRGAAALQVITPDGPGWVVSLHLHWPWPFGKPNQLDEITEFVFQLDGPIIVAGDFNHVPWSHKVRSIARAADAPYLGPRRQTFGFRDVPLPIDHVLSASGTVERMEPVGGDHHGLLARVAFDPQ